VVVNEVVMVLDAASEDMFAVVVADAEGEVAVLVSPSQIDVDELIAMTGR